MAKFSIEVAITNAVTYLGTIEIEAADRNAAIEAARHAVQVGVVEFKPDGDDEVTISGPEFFVEGE